MKIIRSFVIAAAFALPSLASAATFSTYIVFGDSLVDAGNVRIATGGATPSAALGYFQGRFTNGYDYTDLLSIATFGRPTTASLAGGNNFAWGGARVVANTSDTIPDLGLQLGAYTARSLGVGDPNALYVLNFGGNDVFALGRGDTGGLTSQQYAAQVVTQYADSVRYLNALGAKSILITGIPNATDPIAVALEAQLQTALDALTPQLTQGTNFYRFSYLDFFGRVASDPGSLGLPPLRTDTTCLRAQVPGPNIDCTGFFFFDDVHPTAAVQAAAARDINRQFALIPVPEASTWAMMIVGFGVVGATLRRKRVTGGLQHA
jgi:outer membrane lipase/esterase